MQENKQGRKTAAIIESELSVNSASWATAAEHNRLFVRLSKNNNKQKGDNTISNNLAFERKIYELREEKK